MPDTQNTARSGDGGAAALGTSGAPAAAGSAAPLNTLLARIGRSVDDLLHLQVTTVVGTVEVSELPKASELKLCGSFVSGASR